MPAEKPAFNKELDEKHVELIVKFLADIRNGKIKESDKIVLKMVDILEEIISDFPNATTSELVSVLRSCASVCASCPLAGNVSRRLASAARDPGRPGDHSLQRLVLAHPQRRQTTEHPAQPLRDHIAELRAELSCAMSALSEQAALHLPAHEVVAVAGAGRDLERVLRTATHKHCTLLLTHTGPESEALAARLSSSGVSVTLVNFASITGIMSRVNKVVVGVEAVLAGGEVVAAPGTLSATAAAKLYSVPVIALAPLYVLCPRHSSDLEHSTAQRPPYPPHLYRSGLSSSCGISSPAHDLVPPDHISLFITNLGGHSPSYVYRLMSELYDPADYQM